MNPVPTGRLLTGVAVAAAVAVLGAAWPEWAAAWMLVLAGWAAVALLDLAISLRRVEAPEVALPEVVRFSKDRPGAVMVTFTRRAGTPDRFRFTLGLPAGFAEEREDAWVSLPAGVERSRLRWAGTPAHRGRFAVTGVACELRSRWGLWDLRERSQPLCELRVYPDLMSERRAMATLFLDRARFGAKVQRTVGRGREFEKLREYQPGDGYDEIHWKATAKQGVPVTKVFQAERTQEIYVVIDASRLSAREVEHDGIRQTALERYLTAAMVLLLAAEQQGDRFGLVAYANRVKVFLRARTGAAHYGACREAVHALQPDPDTPDPAEIVRYLRTRLRQRALLFFVTDLSDPVLAEELLRQIGPLARQHLVLINQVRPARVAPLFDGRLVDDPAELYQRLAGHVRWAELQAVARALRPLGVTMSLMEEEALAGRLVTQYLEVKRRQAL